MMKTLLYVIAGIMAIDALTYLVNMTLYFSSYSIRFNSLEFIASASFAVFFAMLAQRQKGA
ncbi:hypothetical protein [Pseudidiomarina sp. CB1]|nr:hypothetical protein [Pseudidiomarina sp. CB1]